MRYLGKTILLIAASSYLVLVSAQGAQRKSIGAVAGAELTSIFLEPTNAVVGLGDELPLRVFRKSSDQSVSQVSTEPIYLTNPVTVAASKMGQYSENGDNYVGRGSIRSGVAVFFMFPTTGITNEVASATVLFQNLVSNLDLWDVTTGTNELLGTYPRSSQAGRSIYQDLSSGRRYADRLSISHRPPDYAATLNDLAIADLYSVVARQQASFSVGLTSSSDVPPQPGPIAWPDASDVKPRLQLNVLQERPMFVSSDPTIVSVDGRGRLAGLQTGTATVTVRFRGLTNAVRVGVVAPNLSLGVDALTKGNIGQKTAFIFTVWNQGTDTAREARLSLNWHGPFLGLAASPSQGTATLTTNSVVCALGDLPIAASAKVRVELIPLAAELVWFDGEATSSNAEDGPASTHSTRGTMLMNSPPSVQITTPATNCTYVVPTPLSLVASVSDTDGTVTNVICFANDLPIVMTPTAWIREWRVTWTNLNPGRVIFTAVAYDNQGGTNRSKPVEVSFVPNKLPTLALVKPAAGRSFASGDNVFLFANVSDSDGTLAKLEFYAGTNQLAALSGPPFAYYWRYVPEGNFEITARATDNLGGISTSGPVAITVKATPSGAPSLPQIDAANDASLVVDGNGIAYSWRLGTTPQMLPFPPGRGTWSSMSLVWSSEFTSYGFLAVGPDEQLYQLTPDPVRIPVPSGVTGWRRVYGGIFNFQFALDIAGKLYAWGENDHGQLGICNQSEKSQPVAMSGGPWRMVSPGFNDSAMALDAKGQLFAWGDNSYGELGLGSSDAYRTCPSRVDPPEGATAWIAAAAGSIQAFAIDERGRLFGTGYKSGRSPRLVVGEIGRPEVHGWKDVWAAYSDQDGLVLSDDGKLFYARSWVQVPFPVGVTEWLNAALGTRHALLLGNDCWVYHLALTNPSSDQVSPLPVAVTNLPPLCPAGQFGVPILLVDGRLGSTVTAGASARIEMRTAFRRGGIFYTLDGSQPSLVSPQYSEPFLVKESVNVRAIAYSEDFTQKVEAPLVSVSVLPNYTLTVRSAAPTAGKVTVTPPNGPYLSNSVVALAATANEGWSFIRWAGDLDGVSPVVELTMNSNKTVEPIWGTGLRTSVAGLGMIQKSPDLVAYDYGSMVELLAIPEDQNYFLRWANAATGAVNPVSFKIASPNPLVTALFASVPFQVTMNSPDPGSAFAAGTDIPLGVVLGGDAGQVQRVEFYAGTNRIGSALRAPYQFVWRGVPSGEFALSARAYGSQAATAVSRPVPIRVTSNPELALQFIPPLSFSNGMFQVALGGVQASNVLVQASEDLENWAVIGATATAEGLFDWADLEAAAFPKRFYRLIDPSFFDTNHLAVAVVKGPVSHAQVWFYVLNRDGSQGERLSPSVQPDGRLGSPVQTDLNGNASLIGIPASPTGHILALSTGGQYFDEVTGKMIFLAPGDQFTAVFSNPPPQNVVLTPLTHIAAAQARASAASGVSLSNAVAAANGSVAVQFGLQPITTTVPNLVGALPARQYALVLAGISQLAHDLEVGPVPLFNAWAEDALDGLLDGRNGDRPLILRTRGGQSVSLPGLAALTNAVVTFQSSQSGLALLGIPFPLGVIPLGLNAGGRITVLPTPLPAWIEGRFASVQLEARGGVPPYTWSVDPTSPPPFWLSLTPGGSLTGAPPILVSGSTMRISSPFTVVVTDNARTQARLALRATIIRIPPTILGPPLPAATVAQNYDYRLTGDGGTPPYTFFNNAAEGGFRPFWLRLGLDGRLNGTPSAAGAFRFGVCMVDSVGNQTCQQLGLTVAANPVPCLSIDDVTVTEGDQGSAQAVFLVTLDRLSPVDVTVIYSTADGTATAGEDYVAVAPLQLTIPAGTLGRPITVSFNGDTTFENDETFFVNLANPGNAAICPGQGQGTGTIRNDDAPQPLPVASIDDVSETEGNSGTANASFLVSLSRTNNLEVKVDFATVGGTATAGSDYVSTNGTLTIPAGSLGKSVTVIVKGDTLVEPDETFFVNLSNPVNAVLGKAQGTGTIRNDDPQPLPTVSIDDVSMTEGNSGTANASFLVSLSRTNNVEVKVDFSTANGTAIAGSDYVSTNGTLTIPAGSLGKFITVAVRGDTMVELDENFFVNLSRPENASLGKAQGVGTLRNDDKSGNGWLLTVQVTGPGKVTSSDGRIDCSVGGCSAFYADLQPSPVLNAVHNSPTGRITWAGTSTCLSGYGKSSCQPSIIGENGQSFTVTVTFH